MTRIRFFELTAVLVVFLWPSTALAWGSEGHKIVAYIAARELTPAARVSVASLLHDFDVPSAMARVSTWADEIRPIRPDTAPWHYVDIEIDSAGYDAARDCPNDDCVIAQIDRDRRIIADNSLLPPVRAEALRWLIHLVADIHQPLHCADNHDRGGNGIPIIFHGRRFNMHGLWDVEMVEQLGDDPAAVAAELDATMTPRERKVWQGGTASAWAIEGVRLAQREIYDRYGMGESSYRVVIPDAYLGREGLRVRTQLTHAGLRLAWLLNNAFRSR